MAMICPRCKSDLVAALAGDLNLCYSCSAHYTNQGEIKNPDDSAKEVEG